MLDSLITRLSMRCPACDSGSVCATGKALVGSTENPQFIHLNEESRDWIGRVHLNCLNCGHEWEEGADVYISARSIAGTADIISRKARAGGAMVRALCSEMDDALSGTYMPSCPNCNLALSHPEARTVQFPENNSHIAVVNFVCPKCGTELALTTLIASEVAENESPIPF